MPTDDTSSYAPKSPDLSSFYSSGPTDPAPQLYQATDYGQSQYPSQPPTLNYTSSYAPPPAQDFSQGYTPPATIQYQPPTPHYSSSSYNVYEGQTALFPQEPYTLPFLEQDRQQHQDQLAYLASDGAQSVSGAQQLSKMPPRKSAASAPAPAPIEPSPVRTKFPTARIKRIMQADEEVGKVAQQTPIAVGKALEMFMVQLVNKSADMAKEKGSKRVTAAMLKQVVETDDQWDFLREIVGKVESDKDGAKAKIKVESEESEEEYSETKRKGRGGRRKKA